MDSITITSAQYYNDPDGNQAGVKTTIDGTEIYVPLDTANRHYAAILEWVAEGNTITPAS